jgi:hypothetical protein
MSLSSYKHVIDANVKKTNNLEQTVTSQANTISQIQQGVGLNIDSSSIQVNGEDLETTLNNYNDRINDNKDAIENFTPQNLTANDLTYNGINLKSVLDLEIAKITANEQNINDIKSGNNFTVDATNAIYDNTDPQNPVTVKDKLDTQDGLITDNQNEINNIKNDITDIQNDITNIQNNGSGGGATTTADITHNGSQLDTVINTIQSDVSTLQSSSGGGGSTTIENYKKVLDVKNTQADLYFKCCMVGDYVILQDDSSVTYFSGNHSFSIYKYKNGNLEKIQSFTSHYDKIQKIQRINDYMFGVSSSEGTNITNGAVQIYTINHKFGYSSLDTTLFGDAHTYAYQDRFSVSQNEKYVLVGQNNNSSKVLRVYTAQQVNNIITFQLYKSLFDSNSEAFFSNCITNDGETIITSINGGLEVWSYDTVTNNYVKDLGLNSPVTRKYNFTGHNGEKYIQMIENIEFPNEITIIAYDSRFQSGERLIFLKYHKDRTPTSTVGNMWTTVQEIALHINMNKIVVDGLKVIITNDDEKKIQIYSPDSNNDYVLDESIIPDNDPRPYKDIDIHEGKILLSRGNQIEMWKGLY